MDSLLNKDDDYNVFFDKDTNTINFSSIRQENDNGQYQIHYDWWQ